MAYSELESLSALPVELIEMILTNIHPVDININGRSHKHAKRDLLACALISRTWCDVVRARLFREVEYSFAHLDETEENVPLANRNQRTYSMIYTFLKDSPAIAQYIRKLHLRHKRYFGFAAPVPEYGDFLSFLDLFPNLQELYLKDISVCHSPGDIMYPISRRLLDKLNIMFSPDFKPRRLLGKQSTRVGLQELLACASKVGALTLEGLNRLAWSAELNPTNSKSTDATQEIAPLAFEPPNVTYFTLDSVHDDGKALVSLFTDCIRADGRSLVLTDHELHWYGELLRFLGPRLEKVEISTDNTHEYSDNDTTILQPCINLRELIIDVVFSDDLYESVEQVPALLELLRGFQIPSSLPALSSLILNVDYQCQHEGRDKLEEEFEPGEECLELDTLLLSIVSSTAIPAIVFQWPEYLESANSLIRVLFPTLHSKGMFAFQYTGEETAVCACSDWQ